MTGLNLHFHNTRGAGIDLAAMIAAAAEAEGIVGRPLPSQVLRAGPRTRTIAS